MTEDWGLQNGHPHLVQHEYQHEFFIRSWGGLTQIWYLSLEILHPLTPKESMSMPVRMPPDLVSIEGPKHVH
jgi:hypothetical protein